jgi:cyclase
MAKFRIIASLLTDGKSLVKGSQFNSWRTVGSVISAAKLFEARDIDEITLFDVDARSRGQVISSDLVSEVSNQIALPLSVGGGIESVEDITRLMSAGADKVVLSTAAVNSPEFVAKAAEIFGSQAIAVSLDYRESEDRAVYTNSGKVASKVPFTRHLEVLSNSGVGEIIMQSIDREGSYLGMDYEGVKLVKDFCDVPILVSGGFGKSDHAMEAAQAFASGVCIGSAFQFRPVTPASVRQWLRERKVNVR